MSLIIYGLNQYTKNESDQNYFLGGKSISWKKAMFSIVATETSLLTFMSLPSIGYRSDNLFFLQLAFGYIIGRYLSSIILIPTFYKSNIISIYEIIGQRFGPLIHKIASIIFLITRALADGVRFLLTAIIIKEILVLPIEICILIIGIVTLLYSILGGVKTIINIDSIQFFIYLFGGIFTSLFIINNIDISTQTIQSFFIKPIFKTYTDSSFIFDSYYFINAIFGGILLSFCSHGVDYMMVQRALCTKDIKSAQKSIIGSGFLVFIQFIIFLFIGFLLSHYYDSGIQLDKDREFAYFIVNNLPMGIKGLLIAGILSAAMSTLSSSINALTSSTIIDLKFNFFNKNKKLYIGILWSVILMSIALFFDESNETLIITGIKIASFSYGILLSLFILAKLEFKFSSISIILGIIISFITVFIASYNGIAWTLLIFVGFVTSVATVMIIYFLETNKLKGLSILTFIFIICIFMFANIRQSQSIKYGIDVLIENNFNSITNKNIAVLANKSSVNNYGKNIVDIFIDKKEINLIKIFSPEHGFLSDADAGMKVENSKYRDINIISLYGNNSLTIENKDIIDIDIIIIDLQDIGSTYYTYLSTVTMILNVAAKNNISVIVLDRPNPIGRNVYGPIKEKDYFNFIGMHPIPIRHGMTLGELCKMINGEGWLNSKQKVDLDVIKMKIFYFQNRLNTWVPPSPNIPDIKTALLYNGFCLFEGTNISEGRGTDYPFKLIGAPWINSDSLYSYVQLLKKEKYGSKLNVKKMTFTPRSIKGKSIEPKYKNIICNGLLFDIEDSIEPIELSLYLLKYFYNSYTDFLFKEAFFDILYGSSKFRECLKYDCNINLLLDEMNNNIVQFNNIREKYLLY